MSSLPPFLHPLESLGQISPASPYHSARFNYKNHLGASHVLWWAPRSEKVDTLLFFIPGNPGLVDFYIPFLSDIHKNQSSNFAIIARAHLDHHPTIHNRGDSRYRPDESLTIQVQGALELLEAITSCYTNKIRVVVIGHSVGAWISLQVLKARSEAIHAVFLLFPTISNIGNTPNGKVLYPVFLPLSRSILSGLSVLTKYLPNGLFSLLFPAWPQHQLRVLQGFVSSGHSIMASLSMAHEEMKTINDLDLLLLEDHKNKLYFYYAERDDWVGKERDQLLRVVHGDDPVKQSANIVHGPLGIPHAFCISKVVSVCEVLAYNLPQTTEKLWRSIAVTGFIRYWQPRVDIFGLILLNT